MANLTLGSLFDGSAGFPLGGLLCGITPKWASEIEPFPNSVAVPNVYYVLSRIVYYSQFPEFLL